MYTNFFYTKADFGRVKKVEIQAVFRFLRRV